MIHPVLEQSDLLNKPLVVFGQFGEDHGEMNPENQTEKDGEYDQQRRGIINPDQSSDQIQEPLEEGKNKISCGIK